MPSNPARRADDKRLAKPGKKDKFKGKGPRTRMELYLDGQLKVKDMDDEELAKGFFRNKNGNFKGGRPKNIPRKFFDELRVEIIRRWNESLVDDLEPMKQVLRDIALDKRAAADARHRSAIYLIERTVGKVPEKSEVRLEVAKWEEDIEGVLYETGDSSG